MAEYVDIDAVKEAVRGAECDADWDGRRFDAEFIENALDFIPRADVAPVVRCKDCAHSTLPSELTQRYGKPGTLTCHNKYSPCNRRNVGEDDFCSYGQPKEGAE